MTTLVPASRASFSASQIALGSLAETTSPLMPCCAAVLMYCTWASGLPSCGPTSANVPPNSSTAFLPPASLVSK